MFIKPVLAILSIPFIIITFGIAYFLVNCLMLVLTDAVVPDFEAGSFWTVVGATIVIWLVNLVIGAARHDFERR
jgi:putative membrane protein